jgi:hypothetical protein
MQIIYRPIVIVDQPKDQFECELTQATFTINTKCCQRLPMGSFNQRYYWNPIANNSTYTGLLRIL